MLVGTLEERATVAAALWRSKQQESEAVRHTALFRAC